VWTGECGVNKDRTLVISDIHGCYHQFKELLAAAGYDASRDRLILLGDYVSRGPQSKETVELVKRLVDEQGAIALQGNHDYRFVRVMENRASESEIERFFRFGGIETLQSYCGMERIAPERLDRCRSFMMREYLSHLHFLKSLPFWHEDDRYLFVHAGLQPSKRFPHEQDTRDLLTIREDFWLHETNLDKIVVFGHTPARHIHGSDDIWHGGDKIGIDGGCVFGGQLNGLELTDGEITGSYKILSGSA